MTVRFRNDIAPIRLLNTRLGPKRAAGRPLAQRRSSYRRQTISIGNISFIILTPNSIVAYVKEYRFFPVHI